MYKRVRSCSVYARSVCGFFFFDKINEEIGRRKRAFANGKTTGQKKETKTRKELRVRSGAKVYYQRVLLVFDFSYTWCACAQTRATREELMAAARVRFQTTRCRKSLLAHVAFVRFLSRVNTHVSFQITRFTKTLLAHITLIRFLSSVSTHVTLQMTRLMKALLANITFVRFLSSVNTHVSLQSTRITKTLLANIAFKRFLSSVNTLVFLQSTRITKTLLANIAFKRFLSRVDTHMGFQITRFTKALPANITLVRSLPLRCSCRKSIALFVSYLLIFFRFFVRYFHAQHQLFFFFFSPLCATAHHHDRLRVDRPLRIRTLPSHLCSFFIYTTEFESKSKLLVFDIYCARVGKSEEFPLHV
jgi:hypothetical protein